MNEKLTIDEKGTVNILISEKGTVLKDLKERGYKVTTIDLTKSKHGWFNPNTVVTNHVNELKEKAKKAIKSKKYRKAYRLLSRVKKLQKQFK